MADLLIINEAGQLLYSWHEGETTGDDTLISGFLIALNSFATIERGEEIKSLKLKETTLIFEKFEQYLQKLVFVITTKSEDLITLLSELLKDIIRKFTEVYETDLNKQFNGDVSMYNKFTPVMEELLRSYGMDELTAYKNNIDDENTMKAVMFITPKEGEILYIHAKQYIDKNKVSYLMPFIHTSASVFFNKTFNQEINRILIRTIKDEGLMVESRSLVLLATLYKFHDDFEELFEAQISSKKLDKYVKNIEKLEKVFQKINWNSAISELYIVNPLGKPLFHSSLIHSQQQQGILFPELITVLTSSENLSKQFFNRELFFFSILGNQEFGIACLNFKVFYMVMLFDIKKMNDFHSIEIVWKTLLEEINF